MKGTREKKDKNKLKLLGWSILAFVLIASVVAAFWNWVDLQKKPLEGTKRQFDASLDFVKTIATIAGGVVLFLNFRVANRGAELAQKKLDQETEKAKNDAKLAEARLTMERFSKAVDMMGSDKSIHLRLGGIYALESIALDSSNDKIDENYRQVLEVLTAFVRENAKLKLEEESTISSQPIEQSTAEAREQHDEIPPLPTDIQAALTVLSRRKHKKTDWEQYPLDLRKTDLRRASLYKADLQEARLHEANFQKAYLCGANLQKTYFYKTNLQKATLSEANLQEADLDETNFQEAYLREANLQEARLYKANLQETDLCEANLQDAKLYKVNLQDAYLASANLRGAYLREANLQKAYLDSVNFQEADLRETNLQKAYLYWANLQKADLREADLREANLQDAILLSTNLRNTKNFNQECLEGDKPPFLCNVSLPEGCTANPNRDCERLPEELLKRYPNQFSSLKEAELFVNEQKQKQWDE